VLSFAGLVLGSCIVELAGQASAAAAGVPSTAADDLTVVSVADDPVTLLSGDTSAVGTYPRQLAVRVLNSGVALPTGTQLKLTFDMRLYAPVNPTVVRLGARSVAASSAFATNPDTGASECTIILHESLPISKPGEAALMVVVATARSVLYPRDLVRRPKSPTFQIAEPAKSPRARKDLRPSGAVRSAGTATAWGIELSGGWRKQNWGVAREFVYYYPVQVTMRSVGPGAVPLAASFTVAVDPRLVREITVSWIRLNGKAYHGNVTRVDAVRSLSSYESQWRTPMRLTAGDVLDVGLQASLLTPSGPLPTIKHPVVTLSSMGGTVSQRETGRNTFTRLDSIWQS
jgi:hypothetical protein